MSKYVYEPKSSQTLKQFREELERIGHQRVPYRKIVEEAFRNEGVLSKCRGWYRVFSSRIMGIFRR